MNRFGGFVVLIATATVTIGVAPLAAQAPAPADTTHPAAPPPPNHVETNLLGLKLSGYGEASFIYSTNPNGSVIAGRLYDQNHDQFALNALKLVLERPYATDKLDAGVRADLLFGQNANEIHSGGLTLGENGDLTQLFVTLNLPTKNGNGFQLKAGKIATLMGLEVIETPFNPNWSEGNQFIFVENFTALGLSAEYKFSPHFDAQFRLINGWDVVTDNNTKLSVMGRVGFYPDAQTSIGLVGYVGPEESVAADPTQANRYGIDLLGNHKFGSKTNVWIQWDYGQEKANPALPDPTQDAKWWAIGGWVTYDFTPKVGVALRADYVNDEQGARTSNFHFPANLGNQFGSGTVTLNLRAWPNLLVRPELRYDHSSLTAYDGNKEQVTFAASATYQF
jgi:hypothetical protein